MSIPLVPVHAPTVPIRPIPFSVEDFRKIKAGFEPRRRSDKWGMEFQRDRLTVYRGMTQLPVYEAAFRRGALGFELSTLRRNPAMPVPEAGLDGETERQLVLEVITAYLLRTRTA